MPDVEHYFRIVSALSLDDLMATMDDVPGEVYPLASPSVRLARWLDGDLGRRWVVKLAPNPDGGWDVVLWDNRRVTRYTVLAGPTYNETLACAMDRAEAGATTVGESLAGEVGDR